MAGVAGHLSPRSSSPSAGGAVIAPGGRTFDHSCATVLQCAAMFRAIAFGVAVLVGAACGGQLTQADDGSTSSGNSPQGSSGAGGSSSGGPSAGSSSGQGGSPTASPPSGSAPTASPPSAGAPTATPPSAGAPPGMAVADAGIASPPRIVDAAAPSPPGRDAALVRCNPNGPSGVGGGGGGGPASCDVFGQETCSGVSYSVSCSCPQGTCACFGTGTSVITFAGCPTCPSLPQLFALCGFPQ